ncbi:MAG: hypothetical protein ACUVWP_04695 [bacterium]
MIINKKTITIYLVIIAFFFITFCAKQGSITKSYIWLTYDNRTVGYIEYLTEKDRIVSNIFIIREDSTGFRNVKIKEKVEFKNGSPIFIIITHISTNLNTIIERTKNGWYVKTIDEKGYKKTLFTTKPTAIIDPAFILPQSITINQHGNSYQCQILNFQDDRLILDYGRVSFSEGSKKDINIKYKGTTERFIYSGNDIIPEEGVTSRLTLERRPVKPEKITPLKYISIHTPSSDVFNTDYEIGISGSVIDSNILNEAPQTFKGQISDYSLIGNFNMNLPSDMNENYQYKRAVGLVSSYNSQFIIYTHNLPWQIVRITGLISYTDLLFKDIEILKKNGYYARLAFGLVFDNSKSSLVPHRWLEIYISDVGFLPIEPYPLFSNESQRIRLITGNNAWKSDITYINTVKSLFKPMVGLPVNKQIEYKLKFEKAELGTVSGLITAFGDTFFITFKTDTLWSRSEGQLIFKRGCGTVEYRFNSFNTERPITERTVNIKSDENIFIISPVNPMLLYQLTSSISGDETPLRIRNAVSENIYDMNIINKGDDTIHIQGAKVDVSIYCIPQIDMDIYIDSAGRIVLIESPLCRAELTTPIPKKTITEMPAVEEKKQIETEPSGTIESNTNETQIQ